MYLAQHSMPIFGLPPKRQTQSQRKSPMARSLDLVKRILSPACRDKPPNKTKQEKRLTIKGKMALISLFGDETYAREFLNVQDDEAMRVYWIEEQMKKHMAKQGNESRLDDSLFQPRRTRYIAAKDYTTRIGRAHETPPNHQNLFSSSIAHRVRNVIIEPYQEGTTELGMDVHDR